MIIEHFGGIEYATTVSELCKILGKRYGNGVNEFWINEEKQKTPCMAILVNKDWANVTYFPDTYSSGFQSVGNKEGLNPNESSIFYVNNLKEEIEIGNDTIVTADEALEAAIQFFHNRKIPTCIGWAEN